MAPRKKRDLEEEHENHDRWMVTYADMVTLLMVLFIVMFAISQVDEDKYSALKQSLTAGFGGTAMVAAGPQSVLDPAGNVAITRPDPNALRDLSPAQREAVEAEIIDRERKRISRAYGDAQAEADRLLDLRKRLNRALRAQGLQNDVVATIDRRGLVVSLVSRHVVFRAHHASLTPRGTNVVNTVAKVLRTIPDPIQVDGHTNQAPVQPKYYATDWDLSAARSVTVLRHLNEKQGIAADRLAASAFGQEKPLLDPSKDESRRINKRVDIVVLSSLPAESRELLEQAAKERGGRT